MSQDSRDITPSNETSRCSHAYFCVARLRSPTPVVFTQQRPGRPVSLNTIIWGPCRRFPMEKIGRMIRSHSQQSCIDATRLRRFQVGVRLAPQEAQMDSRRKGNHNQDTRSPGRSYHRCQWSVSPRQCPDSTFSFQSCGHSSGATKDDVQHIPTMELEMKVLFAVPQI